MNMNDDTSVRLPDSLICIDHEKEGHIFLVKCKIPSVKSVVKTRNDMQWFPQCTSETMNGDTIESRRQR